MKNYDFAVDFFADTDKDKICSSTPPGCAKRYRVAGLSDNYIFPDKFATYNEAETFAREVAGYNVKDEFGVVFLDAIVMAEPQKPVVKVIKMFF